MAAAEPNVRDFEMSHPVLCFCRETSPTLPAHISTLRLYFDLFSNLFLLHRVSLVFRNRLVVVIVLGRDFLVCL